MLEFIKKNWRRLSWEIVVFVAVMMLFSSIGGVVLGTKMLGIVYLSRLGMAIGVAVGGLLCYKQFQKGGSQCLK